MRKILFLAAFAMILLGFQSSNAQPLNSANIGHQPLWGPDGYNYVDYYYFPEIGIYYHVPDANFVYYDRGRWTSSFRLPARFRSYDLYRGYKVVINKPRPWINHGYYYRRYAPDRGYYTQTTIRDSRDEHYAYERDEYSQYDRHSHHDNDDCGRLNDHDNQRYIRNQSNRPAPARRDYVPSYADQQRTRTNTWEDETKWNQREADQNNRPDSRKPGDNRRDGSAPASRPSHPQREQVKDPDEPIQMKENLKLSESRPSGRPSRGQQ